MYDGPERPLNELVVLKFIPLEIDDKPVPQPLIKKWKDVHILPGTHKLNVHPKFDGEQSCHDIPNTYSKYKCENGQAVFDEVDTCYDTTCTWTIYESACYVNATLRAGSEIYVNYDVNSGERYARWFSLLDNMTVVAADRCLPFDTQPGSSESTTCNNYYKPDCD